MRREADKREAALARDLHGNIARAERAERERCVCAQGLAGNHAAPTQACWPSPARALSLCLTRIHARVCVCTRTHVCACRDEARKQAEALQAQVYDMQRQMNDIMATVVALGNE